MFLSGGFYSRIFVKKKQGMYLSWDTSFPICFYFLLRKTGWPLLGNEGMKPKMVMMGMKIPHLSGCCFFNFDAEAVFWGMKE